MSHKNDLIVLEQIPYYGMEMCKDCHARETRVIEHHLYCDEDKAVTTTELMCEHLGLCSTMRARMLKAMREQILHGDGDPAPKGLLSELERQSKKEPEA